MKGLKAVEGILPQFLSIIIVIAVSLALLQPETISRFIGETSGFIGMAAASIIGAVTLVPGFVAFPVAGELLKNGAGVLQIAAFVSSLMMVGIITLPMEIKYFGKKAALIRNAAAFFFLLLSIFCCLGGTIIKKKSLIRRYTPVLITAVLFTAFIILLPSYKDKALSSLASQIKTMLLVLPPIFLLLGLLDVWVPRETLMKFMGENSGFKGKFIAFALGSAAVVPCTDFPVAAVLMKKGAGFSNVLIFIGAWSTTKIPMLIFEMQAIGYRFALARLLIDIPGIIIIAFAVKKFLSKDDIDKLYVKAKEF